MNLAFRRLVILCGAIAAALALASRQSVAADGEHYKTVDGLAVYLGILPAEIIKGHPTGHTESEMHDGVPSGKHVHHVMVAVFDSASGQRIADAVVKATVAGLGLAGTEKTLEPMTIADAVTYGNYFNLPGQDLYRIRIEIVRPGMAWPLRVEFQYDHRLQ